MLDRIQRHIVEQTVVSALGLQILDVPVPQTAVFAEQVIEVPKIFLQDTSPQRSIRPAAAGGTVGGSAVGFSVFLCHPAAFCRADR